MVVYKVAEVGERAKKLIKSFDRFSQKFSCGVVHNDLVKET